MSPARPLPKRNPGPDPDFAHGQPLDQHLRCTKASRRHRRKSRIEAQQADHIGTQCAQAFEFARGSSQSRRRRVAAKNSRGSGSKLSATAGRSSARARVTAWLHQRAMAQVQAVEGADADHAALGAQRPAFDVTEQPAH